MLIHQFVIIGKYSRDSSPSSAHHFPPQFGDEFSYNSDDSGASSGNEGGNVSNIKLRKKLEDIKMSKSTTLLFYKESLNTPSFQKYKR